MGGAVLPSRLSVTLAFSSIAAAAIHFAVVGEHFDVGLLHGLFFVTVAWAQVLWALAVLVTPRPAVLTAGIAGNAAIVVVWALSRTVGVPVPPDPWTPEAVGVAVRPDVATHPLPSDRGPPRARGARSSR